MAFSNTQIRVIRVQIVVNIKIGNLLTHSW